MLSDLLTGNSERPTPSRQRRRVDGCDVYTLSNGCHPTAASVHTGRKNVTSVAAPPSTTAPKGKAVVLPVYAGSLNPITHPDSASEPTKPRFSGRSADHHGDIICDPPDSGEPRRCRNSEASRALLRKHSNGDIITGDSQCPVGFTKHMVTAYAGHAARHSTSHLLHWIDENASASGRSPRPTALCCPCACGGRAAQQSVHGLRSKASDPAEEESEPLNLKP